MVYVDNDPIVNAYAADHPATFGGAWIDQAAGGIVDARAPLD